MGKTYYDSTLTDAQIQHVLDAISNILTPSNNGKVLAISGGTLEARSVQWGGGYPEPTGTITLTENGLHDVKDYAEANVQVQGGSIEVIPLSVTANNTYTAPAGKAYSPVTVNVSGGGDDPFAGLYDYLECSGTQYIDTGYIANDDTEIECVVNLRDIAANAETLPFGSRMVFDYDSSYNASLPFYCNVNSQTVIVIPNISNTIFPVSGFRTNEANTNYYGSGRPLARKVYNQNIKVRIVLSTSEFRIETDAGDRFSQALTSLGSLNANTAHLTLFGLNTNGNILISPKFAVYRYQIREKGILLHEYLPHKDVNDVVCMRDTITGDLKYNAGTGVFVFGTDI